MRTIRVTGKGRIRVKPDTTPHHHDAGGTAQGVRRDAARVFAVDGVGKGHPLRLRLCARRSEDAAIRRRYGV